MNAIVVTFDRLPIGLLACCGNGWIDTPNFDRLAAQSALFQQHFADCPAPESASRAWWTGRYVCKQPGNVADRPLLPKLLAEHGVTSRLLVERTVGTAVEDLGPFPKEWTASVEGIDGLDVAPEETPFFRLVARAQRDLRLLRTSRREPWLLWLKSRGIPAPWLAPREFATQFLDLADDEEAEPGPEESDEPESDSANSVEETVVEMTSDQFDELLRSMSHLPTDAKSRDALSSSDLGIMRRVCGGYVALLDAALGRLMAQIDQEGATSPTLLIVTAATGVTVRQPGLLLDSWESLAEEIVHTPLFVRVPGANQGLRRQELVQTVDLFPTLAEWFGIDVSGPTLDGKSLLPLLRGEEVEPRTRALIADGQRLAGLRTSEFYLVTQRGQADEGDQRRLFAKPEDIWETNDIAAQSPDVVDQLAAEVAEILNDKQPPA